MLAPSDFFKLLPEFNPTTFRLKPSTMDQDDSAVALVELVQRTALTDLGLLEAPTDQPGLDAVAFMYRSILLALKANDVALNVVQSHNPDGEAGGVPLDLVRVVQRASRGNAQRARKMLAVGRPSWLQAVADAR